MHWRGIAQAAVQLCGLCAPYAQRFSRAALRVSLGAAAGWALLTPDPGHGQTTCLDAATSVETADPLQTDYVFDSSGKAVDARGVHWLGLPDHAIRPDGIWPGCWVGGDVEGPYRESSVYDCEPIHCPGGVCPTPCWAYHTSAGMRVDAAAPVVVEDLRVSDYGDGIERSASANRQPLVVKRAYLHDIHDDAIENDWGSSVTVVDSLLERVNTAFASRPRTGEVIDASDEIFEVRDSLVLLHSFANSRLMTPGHGKFWKWPKDGTGPDFIVTGNTFVVTDYGGVGLLPLANQVLACADNALLWADSQSSFDTWIADPELDSDGLTSGGRANALSHCFTFIVKPDAQSQVDFLAANFDPLVAAWKQAHAAAVRTDPPGFACFDGMDNDFDRDIDFPDDLGCSDFTDDSEDSGGSPTDEDGDGHPLPGDCDDTDAAIFPGANEVCNGLDDDCDGGVDEGYAPEATSCGVAACGATGATSCVA
ncbi:MAG: putative metal-binding motif-containing protein, partial [Myxococcota bacterium]